MQGYTGVEIAAFTLVKESVNELDAAQRKELVTVMNDYGLENVGLHWLLAPPPEGFILPHQMRRYEQQLFNILQISSTFARIPMER